MNGSRKLRDISPPKRMETARLLLRTYRGADAAALNAMLQRHHDYFERFAPLGYYVMVSDPNQYTTQASLAGHISGWQKPWDNQIEYQFGVFLKDTGDFVGEVTIRERENHLPEYYLTYFGDTTYTGQGYLTEAVQAAVTFVFEHLKAHRATVWCDDTNSRNLQVAERCGFVLEVHLREDTFHPDGMSGTYTYGMLRSEFEALRQETT